MKITAATITNVQIYELFNAEEIAAIDLMIATRSGWNADERLKMRERCAELFNALTLRRLTDDQIPAEYNGELGVWSVGVTLPSGTYVGFGCATAAEIARAKAQVRARCAELLGAENPA